jgi:hypothetical protein
MSSKIYRTAAAKFFRGKFIGVFAVPMFTSIRFIFRKAVRRRVWDTLMTLWVE